MSGRRWRGWRVSVVAGAVIATVVMVSGCAVVSGQGGGAVQSVEEVRDQMLVHVDRIEQLVGMEWENEDATGATSCSLRPGQDGAQWAAERLGRIEGLSSEAARVVAEYLEGVGFEVRIRENRPDRWDVIARAEDGLRLQFGSGDNGGAVISAQSVCVPRVE